MFFSLGAVQKTFAHILSQWEKRRDGVPQNWRKFANFSYTFLALADIEKLSNKTQYLFSREVPMIFWFLILTWFKNLVTGTDSVTCLTGEMHCIFLCVKPQSVSERHFLPYFWFFSLAKIFFTHTFYCFFRFFHGQESSRIKGWNWIVFDFFHGQSDPKFDFSKNFTYKNCF